MPLISLSLYTAEIDLLDNLVLEFKKRSFTPHKVNRSTVIRELISNSMREIQKSKSTGGN